MRKICFICSGNTCRSPMAEKLLKKKLKDMCILSFQVSSAGIMATGENISELAKQVLKENSIRVTTKKSKKLTSSMLKKSNVLFLTMTNDLKLYLNQNNVYSIAEFINKQDVSDPYGGNINDYRAVYKQLDEYTSIIADKIKKIAGDKNDNISM